MEEAGDKKIVRVDSTRYLKTEGDEASVAPFIPGSVTDGRTDAGFKPESQDNVQENLDASSGRLSARPIGSSSTSSSQ